MSYFAPVQNPVSLSPLVVPVLVLPQQTLFPMMKLPLRIHLGALPKIRPDGNTAGTNLLVVNQAQVQRGSSGSTVAIGCLADVQSHRCEDDEHQLLFLKGKLRVRFELHRDSSAQLDETLMARVDQVSDRSPAPSTELAPLRQELIDLLRRNCPELALPEMTGILECELPFGQLVDLAAVSLRLKTDDLIEILHELNVEARCRLLLTFVEYRIQQRRSMVNRFGVN